MREWEEKLESTRKIQQPFPHHCHPHCQPASCERYTGKNTRFSFKEMPSSRHATRMLSSRASTPKEKAEEWRKRPKKLKIHITMLKNWVWSWVRGLERQIRNFKAAKRSKAQWEESESGLRNWESAASLRWQFSCRFFFFRFFPQIRFHHKITKISHHTYDEEAKKHKERNYSRSSDSRKQRQRQRLARRKKTLCCLCLFYVSLFFLFLLLPV